MASRDELQLLKDARSGKSESQTALGRIYLFGSQSLPQSKTTALHWLSKAARKGDIEAKLLIGKHIPFDVCKSFPEQKIIQGWYQEALENGEYQAGLALAQIILDDKTQDEQQRNSAAIHILELVARHEIPDAQWLLAELTEKNNIIKQNQKKTLVWTEHAAQAGIVEAQIALAEHCWAQGEWEAFLKNAHPIAKSLLKTCKETGQVPDNRGLHLLLNCAKTLLKFSTDYNEEIREILEIVATNKIAEAAFLLGLWYAKMDETGKRAYTGLHATSFKRAIHWLTIAGEQGLSKAWYALACIYQKPEFAQRDIAHALDFLKTAANLGHPQAQYEMGIYSWRTRKEKETNDIQAVFWLQKAKSNGQKLAEKLLDKIAYSANPEQWAINAKKMITREITNSHPFLVARIELAAIFGLTRAEALLINLHNADKEHCLLVDISETYHRSKRRIILIKTGKERQLLSKISRLFENVDCSFNGPEGNYRQRQYRLRTLFPNAYKQG